MAKKKENKKPSEDLLRLLRALFKMSVAINDADGIIDEKKYYKFMFKKELDNWMIIFPTFSHAITKKMYEVDKELFSLLFDAFLKNGISISSDNTKRIDLINFYIKMKSAINDLQSIEKPSDTYPSGIMLKFSSDLINQLEKQYPDVKLLKDANGIGIQYLIDYFDDYGKSIVFVESDK
jgi:hypothetical protein